MAAPTDTKGVRALKKLENKLRKIEKIMSSKEQLVISKQPTRTLCAQNGGLGNNVSQAELLPLFAAFGDVDDVVMIPRKQYCFVSFTDVACASQALHHLNGHLLRRGKDPTQDVILYLLYVERAPSNMMPSSEKPPGLHIVENFVSDVAEETLLKFISVDSGESSKDTGVMKHRLVKHFGFEFKYDINDVDIKDPLPDGIPPACHDILHRAQSLGLINHCPDQLTINQYKPGQGIPPHVDTVDAFEDGIMSLSLGSQTVMDFRHPDGRHLVVPVPRCSLLVMTGESRYVWSHGITPRKSDIIPTPSGDGLTLQNRGVRTSFTFRKVIMNRESKSIRMDDTNATQTNLPQNDAEAIALEKHHVHKVYDDIATHFSGTRYKPWPKVADFMLKLPPFSLVADVGCGNGKCLGLNTDLFEIGCDYSSNLASICGRRGFETCVADVTCLPFRSNRFDVVLCIAVVHHMSTKDRRIKAISEVVRILHTGGKALIYVWAMEQDYNKTPSKYITTGIQRKQIKTENSRNVVDNKSRKDLTEANECLEKFIQEEQLEDIGDHTFEQTSSNLSSEVAALPIEVRRKPVEVSTELNDILERNGKDGADLCTDNSAALTENKLHVHVNRTQFKEQDMLVPWQLKCAQVQQDKVEEFENNDNKPNIYHRFYHVFRQGELEAVCKRVEGCVVRRSYYDQGNWCVVLEKL